MHARVEIVPPTDTPLSTTRATPVAGLGLRARLAMLVVSLLLPALIVAALLIGESARRSYQLQERQLTSTARSLSLVVDRQLSEQAGLLRALTVSMRLKAADWPAFDAQSRAALGDSGAWVVVRTADGQQLVNTSIPQGATLPKVPNPRVPANRHPRTDGIRISNIAQGAVARAPVIVVVKAVTLDDGRQVDVSIVSRASQFSELLRRQGLPASWVGSLMDGDYRVIARSRQEPQFLGRAATPVALKQFAGGDAGVFWGRSLDGIPTRAAYERVPESDWVVVLGLPRTELVGPAQSALITGSLLALALLAVGVVMALRMGGTVARAVDGLGKAANTVDRGVFVSPPHAGIPELDHLARAFEAAAARVREREDSHQLLINELNHRVKNTLATIQSVAKHSRAGAETVDQFHDAFEGRVLAMSGAHELLTRSGWASTDLGELARAALRPFEGPRLRISGPPVQVEPTDTLNITLVLHELATNALKYGALSGPAGYVDLTWKDENGAVCLQWRESGGPPVQAPTRRGFGSRLINRARDAFQPSEHAHHPEGVRCTLTLKPRR